MGTPEKELLNSEDFESFYASIYEEFGEKPQAEAEKTDSQPSGKPRETGADRNTYADKQKNVPPVKKDHSIRNLTILIILELLGIAGVVAWWILRLL